MALSENVNYPIHTRGTVHNDFIYCLQWLRPDKDRDISV